MNVNVSHERVADSIAKLEPNKSCGPDNGEPKLIKVAEDAIIPLPYYLILQEVAYRNIVPSMWKYAKVTPLFKKNDETDKENYHPFSLLSIPGKLMESVVASIYLNTLRLHYMKKC